MTSKELTLKVAEMVKKYIKMRTDMPNSNLYQEAMWQFADMANGGRAFDGNQIYIRDEYYPNYPDEFFFRVISGLGEFERYLEVAGNPPGLF